MAKGYGALFIIGLIALAALACASSSATSTIPPQPTATTTPTAVATPTSRATPATVPTNVAAVPTKLTSPTPTLGPSTTLILASGEFPLPAASSFGSPGFHHVLTASHRLPEGLAVSDGTKLVLALRDIGRPGISCSREHPLSGCATVDWSDFEGRPGVPPDGVFKQRLTFSLTSGESNFSLSDSGSLNPAPDPYKPG